MRTAPSLGPVLSVVLRLGAFASDRIHSVVKTFPLMNGASVRRWHIRSAPLPRVAILLLSLTVLNGGIVLAGDVWIKSFTGQPGGLLLEAA
jgi:hypothetical protein